MAKCKKCKSKVFPLEVNPGQRYSQFICPVCKTKMSSGESKGILSLAGIALIVWAVMFIHHQLTS